MSVAVHRYLSMPGAMFVDARVTLLDLKIVAFLSQHVADDGWMTISPHEMGALPRFKRSRESMHQRLVRLCEWGYLERQGEAGKWQWRTKLDPSARKTAEALTARPEPEKINEFKAGEIITSLVKRSPTGETLTNWLVKPSPGETATSPVPPKEKTNTPTLEKPASQVPPTSPPKAKPPATRLLSHEEPFTAAFRQIAREEGLTDDDAQGAWEEFAVYWTDKREKKSERGWKICWRSRCKALLKRGFGAGAAARGGSFWDRFDDQLPAAAADSYGDRDDIIDVRPERSWTDRS